MGARRGEAALACFRLPTALLHGLHRARSEDLGYGPCNQFVSRLAGLKSILTDDLRRDSQQNPGLQAGVVQNHELVGEGDCCSEIGERLSISSADDCLRYVVTALRDALLHSLHVELDRREDHENDADFVSGQLGASHDSNRLVAAQRSLVDEARLFTNERVELVNNSRPAAKLAASGCVGAMSLAAASAFMKMPTGFRAVTMLDLPEPLGPSRIVQMGRGSTTS